MSDTNQTFAIGAALLVALTGIAAIWRSGGSISVSKDGVVSANVNPPQ